MACIRIRQEEKAAELRVLEEQVEENERLLQESQKTWDEKLKEAQRAADERSRVLTRMGLAECGSSDAKYVAPFLFMSSFHSISYARGAFARHILRCDIRYNNICASCSGDGQEHIW